MDVHRVRTWSRVKLNFCDIWNNRVCRREQNMFWYPRSLAKGAAFCHLFYLSGADKAVKTQHHTKAGSLPRPLFLSLILIPILSFLISTSPVPVPRRSLPYISLISVISVKKWATVQVPVLMAPPTCTFSTCSGWGPQCPMTRTSLQWRRGTALR